MKVYSPICLVFLASLGAISPQARAAEPVVVYEARGILKAFDPATHQATISHDAIPGYMQAMTMAFAASKPAELANLRPGDILSFHLCVTAQTAWIDHVIKTGASTAPLLEPAQPRPARELAPGDFAPQVQLTNQAGKSIRLGDFKGQAVAITFIYTGCPLPTYCPLMTHNFSEAQSLMTRIGAGDHWQLLSVSMDPAHDTPPVLAAFASANHADPAHWNFVTGDQAKVREFGSAFGLQFKQSGNQIYHNLRTVVLDTDGRIRSIYPGNEWTPQQLASDLRRAMRHSPLEEVAP